MDIVNVNGYLWPASDTECRKVVFNTAGDMDPAIALCRSNGLAFQAGGNCGVWANYLSTVFDTVFTCEPEPLNFHCLSRNIKRNIQAFQCGVGESEGTATMDVDPKNMGAGQLEMQGPITVTTIDRLLRHREEPLDFLCLDIEGMELMALKGAINRITRDRPVIMVEDKGLSKRYGTDKGAIENWLAKFQYVVHSRPHRDVILVPKELMK